MKPRFEAQNCLTVAHNSALMEQTRGDRHLDQLDYLKFSSGDIKRNNYLELIPAIIARDLS